ncbi:hypothetical protein JMJ77_0011927 [Colletotrichum scovillei]|uniref:F-box domain-containing protein n=1 Tax=Colletotrichum scovillei TaxID=1209932 RepID=A0A9P7U8A8_9PEZI|nr:hypothetical protein JMJ77_0011927 [Colletotrichum scovillei]KAG7046212.1 hypothetical protein JMJ78_0011278 [Colletotrichum scovillei]KAG7063559.1 hypothetical protein JMJ76_0006022 [Colletotrichum scovillei]
MHRLTLSLAALPRELLVKVCEILYYDDYAASLASFSAANKTCRDAAVGVLFRTIKFTIEDGHYPGAWHSLHLDSLSCERTLRRNGVLSQVRRISIEGESPKPQTGFDKDSRLTDIHCDYHWPEWKQGRVYAAEMGDDDARKMKDSYLERDHPRPDSYELDLVRSPSIYSINCSHFVDHTTVNQLNKTVLRILATMGPGLQEVYVTYDPGQRPPDELREAAWSGVKDLEPPSPQYRASLRTFHLGWHPDMTEDSLLREWGSLVDFDALRVLRLPDSLRPKGLELLDTYSFPFLKNLVVNMVDSSSMDDPEHERGEMLSRFIDRRTQLCTLEVIGWNDFYVGKHLFHPACGFALRTLDLQSNLLETADPFNARAVSLIAQRWPLLEDLAIRVRRSKGDEEEMAVYVALGRLRRLRKLHLRLMPMQRGWQFPEDRTVQSPREYVVPRETHGEGAENQLNPNDRENYRDLLINIALDETLARAIFHAISTEGGTSQHQNLEKLQLRVDDWLWAEQLLGRRGEVAAFCSILGRPWDVRRDPRFEHRSEVSVLLVEDKFNNLRATAGMVPDLMESLLHEVFREIWPRAEGSDTEARHSWQTDWKSFPLSAYVHRS